MARLEIDDKKMADAMDAYLGPTTTGKGFVEWVLARFTKGELGVLEAMNRPTQDLKDDHGKVSP